MYMDICKQFLSHRQQKLKSDLGVFFYAMVFDYRFNGPVNSAVGTILGLAVE
jgi:hypothetical protein